MNVAFLFLGLALLVAGRRLYWLFVAAVGFGVGSLLAQEFFVRGDGAATRSAWIPFAIAILGGIVGALLAVLFQKLAVSLAGAAAGGSAGWVLFEAMRLGNVAWVGLVLGALVGGILVLKLFDWGLILFSSLAGAKLLVIDGMQMDLRQGALLFLAAFVFGVVVQGLQLAMTRKAKEEPQRREQKQA